MHKGTVEKPKSIKMLVFLTIITLVIIGLSLIPTPQGETKGVKGEETWGDVIMKFFQEDSPSATSIHPTQKKYRVCRDDNNGVKTCKPDGVTIFAKILRYDKGVSFNFVMSWKEKGVLKERAPFNWDIIANPNYGTWHQLGSRRNDSGIWRLESLGKDGVFHGWHIAKNSRKYSMSLEPI